MLYSLLEALSPSTSSTALPPPWRAGADELVRYACRTGCSDPVGVIGLHIWTRNPSGFERRVRGGHESRGSAQGLAIKSHERNCGRLIEDAKPRLIQTLPTHSSVLVAIRPRCSRLGGGLRCPDVLLGRRLDPKLLGQLADLRRRIASVPAKGLQERELAFLGPAGHGLGRHLQDVGHLGGMEVAGCIGGGLATRWGCHGASLSCGGPAGAAGPETRRRRSSGHHSKNCRDHAAGGHLPPAGRTGRSCRPTQVPAIVLLGCFSVSGT